MQQAKGPLRMSHKSWSHMLVRHPSSPWLGSFISNAKLTYRMAAHCLDDLRQESMCILGQLWIYPNTPSPYVDCNKMHKCRYFNAIRQGAEERQDMPPGNDDWLGPSQAGDRIYDLPCLGAGIKIIKNMQRRNGGRHMIGLSLYPLALPIPTYSPFNDGSVKLRCLVALIPVLV